MASSDGRFRDNERVAAYPLRVTNDRSGTDDAAPGRWAPRTARHPTPTREARIRTLGVGLIAIAAIVASLTVVRQRQDAAHTPEGEKGPNVAPAASSLDLDQLRAAGM